METKKKLPSLSRGVVYTICGTIIIVLLTLLAVICIGFAGTWITTARAGGAPAMGLLLSFTPCIVITFIALEAVFILWDKNHKKRSRLILLIAVILTVGCILFCALNTYVCGEDGLHRFFLGESAAYPWEEVVSATASDDGNAITVTLRYRNNRVISLTAYSTAQTRRFVEVYGSQLGYAAAVKEYLREKDIFMTVTISDTVLDKYRDTEDYDAVLALAGKAE